VKYLSQKPGPKWTLLRAHDMPELGEFDWRMRQDVCHLAISVVSGENCHLTGVVGGFRQTGSEDQNWRGPWSMVYGPKCCHFFSQTCSVLRAQRSPTFA